MSTFVVLAGWLVACSSPAKQAAADYVRRVQPLMVENSALAEQMLLQGAAVYNGAAGPDDVAVAWEKRIVPMSEHLASQASFVPPPPEYQATHANLVKIWTDRAVAYRAMSEATRTANAQLWNAARTKVDQVNAQETAFFRDLNSQLSPLSLQVDPYP
jgi:hypothetical protein